jgi:hypothetical protein
MRLFALTGLLLGGAISFAQADPTMGETNATVSPEAPRTMFDSTQPAEAQVPGLHQAWLNEHDPAKRKALAGELIQAVIHEFVSQEPEIVAEVARDGAPENDLQIPANVRTVGLSPLTALAGAHADSGQYPRSPVFRRLSADRVEAWTAKEGWLFDNHGRMVADVKVPRRDGSGREWFGAFLPNGAWITTDLWENDKQLSRFTAQGSWKWELEGTKILAELPKAKPMPNDGDEPIYPSIGWARADKTGRRWLVCLGTEFSRAAALVTPTGKVLSVPEDASVWQEVYPRAMGVRGFYIALTIESDDGKVGLNRSEAGHGIEVGWPTYDLSNQWSVVIPDGDDQFGFWPGAHDTFIEADEASHVWFFDARGKYEGEILGSYLADSANGTDLLFQDGRDDVVQVHRGKGGLIATEARRFTWPDGSQAVPLAMYDGLKLGFFLRGTGMEGTSDDARRARGAAEIVLAKWKD